MNLDEFLRLKAASWDEVLRGADQVLNLIPGDMLFAAGSLAEDLGNEKSDFDFFLVTSRRNIEFTSLHDVAFSVGDCLIDVRVLETSAFRELLGRFSAWETGPRRPRAAFEFTEDERKFLHRLYTGHAVYGEKELAAAKLVVGEGRLARHKLDWAVHLAGTLQVDLAGFRGAGELESMLFVAQDLLGHSIDALLAGYGNTNPITKWRTKLLGRLPADLERRLPGRMTGLGAPRRYLELHRGPDSLSPAAITSHCLRVAAQARIFLSWSERALLSGERPELPAMDWGRQRTPGTRLPELDVDVHCRYEKGQFVVHQLGRDNEFCQLSELSYYLLCLFDGQTTQQEALTYAELLSPGNGEPILQHLLNIVRDRRFAADCVVDGDQLRAILKGRRIAV